MLGCCQNPRCLLPSVQKVHLKTSFLLSNFLSKMGHGFESWTLHVDFWPLIWVFNGYNNWEYQYILRTIHQKQKIHKMRNYWLPPILHCDIRLAIYFRFILKHWLISKKWHFMITDYFFAQSHNHWPCTYLVSPNLWTILSVEICLV